MTGGNYTHKFNMKTSKEFRSQVLPSTAFTLVEMLVVIAVIGLITTAVAPMVFGTLISTRLSSSGQTFVSAISLAHEMAVSGGEDIELRIYRYVITDEPGSTEAYRAIALIRPGKTPNEPGLQIGDVIRCPSGIVIGDNQNFSPILADASVRLTPDAENIIRSTTALYKAFRFRPDGTTDLPADAKQCYFTLAEERLLQGRSSVPANFFAVQIDPLSGRTSTYRP